MYKICKTERSIERQKLFQTTLLSMMEKKPYRSITVTSLCLEMEIPRKTFYRYFDSLNDILDLIVDEILQESFLFLEIKTDLFGYFNYWKQKKYLLDVFEKNGLSSLLITKTHENLFSSIKKKETSIKELKYSTYVTALFTLLLSWHQSGMTFSIEEISDLVDTMFIRD